MNRLLTTIIAAGLLLMPVAAIADYIGSTPSGDKPPVAQTLVREGDYAVRLVAALQMGEAENEADAENILAVAGIAPTSGWISDFPVTPAIIAQVEASITDAANDGKLTIGKYDANQAFLALDRDLGLAVVPGTADAVTASDTEALQYPEPAVINNYYDDEGPPVVTYYAPPPDYWYLYAWDPFPFWCRGFYFPGYFVLRDFTTVVVVNSGGTVIFGGHHGIHHHDGFHTRILSNHVVDPVTRASVTIDPVHVRPTSRTSFSPLGARDFSQVRASNTGGSAISRGEHRTPSGFDRTGAQSIFRRSVSEDRATTSFTTGRDDRTPATFGRTERTITGTVSRPSGDRNIERTAPAVTIRSFDRPAVERGTSFSTPSRSAERSFSTPSSGGGRSIDSGARSSSGDRHSFGGFGGGERRGR